MNKPKIIIVVGLDGIWKDSAAGKLAAEYDAILVDYDKIKSLYDIKENGSKVISKILKRSKYYLSIGKNVVLNIPSVKRSFRHGIIQSYTSCYCDIMAYIVNVPFERCLMLNRYSKYPVEESQLYCQLKQFQIPFYEEGFNEIEISNFKECKENFNFYEIAELSNVMANFNQKNKHHKFNLHFHCSYAAMIYDNTYYTDNDPINFIISRALFLHDIGKVFIQTFDEEGEAHYYCHENVGTYYLLNNLSNNVFGNKEIFLCLLFYINYHMKPFKFDNPRVKKKYEKIFGKYKLDGLIKINNCDRLAKG